LVESHNLKIITHNNPKSPVAEAYRILRTNLNFAALDKPFKTLLVTSSGPSEGKSTTLANLGVAMVQAGVSTLILDCDLRKPLQHKVFNLPNLKGFTNLLVNRDIMIEDVIQDTQIPGLKVMSSGPVPPNPSELLASKRTSQVIEELQNKFQLVLIDSPPVVAVADAAILASKVDGVIIVVRSHITRRNMAEEAKSLLDKASANIIGVVLNGVPMSGEDYYYYYYYGHGSVKNKTFLDKLGLSRFFKNRGLFGKKSGNAGEDGDLD
jgi:capsular exopolysaccharide synthesis family protein